MMRLFKLGTLGVLFAALVGCGQTTPAPAPVAKVVVIKNVPDAPAIVAPQAEPPALRPKDLARGYHADPEAVQKYIATLPVKFFSATATGGMSEAALPKFAYLWQAYEKISGSKTPLKDQNPTGSCVGFGTTTAVERSLANEIYTRIQAGDGDESEMALFSEEVTYAGSRVEANGGKCPIKPTRRDPSPDGSNGSWAARWVTTGGMLPKGKYGTLDLTNYDPKRAHSWNYSGVPNELEPICAKYKVGTSARITNWADAKKALANGYGIAECSNILFDGPRDANGVAHRSLDIGGHCMCLDGYFVADNGKEYGHIENSWSGKNGSRPFHTGPTGWGAPTTAGFWADSEIVGQMLAQGDSWAYSAAQGFPRQDIDWFAMNNSVRKTRGTTFASNVLNP